MALTLNDLGITVSDASVKGSDILVTMDDGVEIQHLIVDHGQKRGGYVHDPDSAHPCRGDEPRQIRHRSPAEPDDHPPNGSIT